MNLSSRVLLGSRRGRVAVSAFAGCCLCGLVLAVPADAAASGPVPTVDCVATSPDGTEAIAYFGYVNSTGSRITIPEGDDNQAFPVGVDQGEPTEFDPGSYPAVFSIDFDPVHLPLGQLDRRRRPGRRVIGVAAVRAGHHQPRQRPHSHVRYPQRRDRARRHRRLLHVRVRHHHRLRLHDRHGRRRLRGRRGTRPVLAHRAGSRHDLLLPARHHDHVRRVLPGDRRRGAAAVHHPRSGGAGADRYGHRARPDRHRHSDRHPRPRAHRHGDADTRTGPHGHRHRPRSHRDRDADRAGAGHHGTAGRDGRRQLLRETVGSLAAPSPTSGR